jgi:tRNA (guanine37-N1)-methyltransferase
LANFEIIWKSIKTSSLRDLYFRGQILAIPRIKSVVNDEKDSTKRLLLLSESLGTDKDTLSGEKEIQKVINELGAEIVTHEVVLGFDHYTTHEVLAALLPEGLDIPSSFETVGHVAHVNLRDEHEPYKALIGQVILEKNAHIRTVVNKVGTIDSTFRFFQMEVISGEDDMIVEVNEEGCHFKFNYAKVYWNSRLQAEHRRLVSLLRPESTVCDMFCGVGPFALPAAKRDCTVYANDLNPESVHWLNINTCRNKLESRVHIYNMDAREFVKKAIEDLAESRKGAGHFDHFIMNLPASAHEFLDVFPKLAREGRINTEMIHNSTIHCYIFCKTDEDPIDKVQSGLGYEIERNVATVKRVRDVAPNKEMFCVSFKLPEIILHQRKFQERSEELEKTTEKTAEVTIEGTTEVTIEGTTEVTIEKTTEGTAEGTTEGTTEETSEGTAGGTIEGSCMKRVRTE